MSGPAELSLATGMLVDSAINGTVVMALATGLTALMRKGSAAHRHAVWTVSFASLPLLPVFAWSRCPDIALDSPVLLAIWGLGFSLFILPVMRGLWRLRAVRSGARPHPTEPGVWLSSAAKSPVTWGVFRPVIVMPADTSSWCDRSFDAALHHERAHVARRDWAVHIGAWILGAVFWFHPLVWWARRALSREAEHAADDAVLAQGVRPSDYAALLVDVARFKTPRAALGASSSMVSTRVAAILEPRARSSRRWPIWLAALLLCASWLPVQGAWPAWMATEAPLTCEPNGYTFP